MDQPCCLAQGARPPVTPAKHQGDVAASPASVGSYRDDDPGSRPAEHCGGLALVLANAIVEHCWLILVAWTLIFGTSCCFAHRLLEVVQASYEPQPGMPSFPAKQVLDDHFPGLSGRVVDSFLFSSEPHVDEFDALSRLQQAVKAIEKSVHDVKSRHPRLLLANHLWQGDLSAGKESQPKTYQELLQVTWDTSGPDGRWRASRAAGELLRAADEVEAVHGSYGVHVIATGPHALEAAARAQAQKDIGVHAVMFLPFAILTMHTHLRRWVFLPLPALCSALAQALSFGLEYAVALHGAVDQNVPTFMAFLCVSLCIDWSFFLLARFVEEEPTHGHLGAITIALSRTGANIALSGCLIVACSACMLLMPPAIASNAVGGTISVAAALVVCLTFLPACMAAFPGIFGACGKSSSAELHIPAKRQAGWYLWADGLTQFPRNLVALVLLSAALLPLALRLCTCALSVNPHQGLPSSAPTLLAQSQLRRDFPAVAGAQSEFLILTLSPQNCSAGVKSDGHFLASCRAAQRALSSGFDRRKKSVLGVSLAQDGTAQPKCLSWRTHFKNDDEAMQAQTGAGTPSGHLLLTGETKHMFVFPSGLLPSLREEYAKLWGRSVSRDRRVSFTEVRIAGDSINVQGFGYVRRLRRELADTPKDTGGTCGDVRLYEYSETGVWYDYVMASVQMLPRAVGLACVVTTLCVAAYFRSAVAPGKLLLTVVLPLASVYGAAVVCFQDGLLDTLGPRFPLHSTGGLHWMIPCSTSMLLLSLALDYNIFYFGRVAEFRSGGFSDLESIKQGLASTGPVITRAGLIFALEFAGLLVSRAPLNRQGGFVVVIGILLDTFVVRSCLAPAVLSLKAEWNWWPTTMPEAMPENVDELLESLAGEGI